MKKPALMMLLPALLIIAMMSGCFKDITRQPDENAVGRDTRAAETAADRADTSDISEEEAAETLTEYLGTIGTSKETDANLVIALDRTEEADGHEYYVFHVFDNMEGHTATLGWYGVRKEDGGLYDFMLMQEIG